MIYEYRAHVVSVYDGDTFRADVDLGFRVTCRALDFRLLGLNAPEMRGEFANAGLDSRDALRGLILDRDVTVLTRLDKQEKYGRWLATVFVADADGRLSPRNVNQWLLDNHFAIPYLT